MTLWVYSILSVFIFVQMTSALPQYGYLRNDKSPPKISLVKRQILIKGPEKNKLISKPDTKLVKLLEIVTKMLTRESQQAKTNKCNSKICIDNIQHNENSVVINNPRKQGKQLRYYDSYSSSHESRSHESYEKYYDNQKGFIDLTRGEVKFEKTGKNILAVENEATTNKVQHRIQRNIDSTNRFSTDYIDFNDLRSNLVGKENAGQFLRLRVNSKNQKQKKRRNAEKQETSKNEKAIQRTGNVVVDISVESNSDENRKYSSEESAKNLPTENEGTGSEDEAQETETAEVTDKPLRARQSSSEEQSDSAQETNENTKEDDDKSKEEADNSNASDDTPKRFEVIKSKHKKKTKQKEKAYNFEEDNFDVPLTDSIENFPPTSGELTSLEKPKPKKEMFHSKKETYIQAPGRLVKVGPQYKEYRRRLQHFLPKRYHWHEDEFQNLGYYWFNGPQGRVPPGPWRISY